MVSGTTSKIFPVFTFKVHRTSGNKYPINQSSCVEVNYNSMFRILFNAKRSILSRLKVTGFLIFFLSILSFFFISCGNKHQYQYPFLDPSLSIEERVNDLVGRMTLDEKISQMINQAPAIPRLGVPEYNWWNEGLHGSARAGLATVYPQAIGLGATWDEGMLFRVASAISDETRAKHH